VIFLKKEQYKKLVENMAPKENRLKNLVVSFLVGGTIGLIGEILVHILKQSFGLAELSAFSWTAFIIIGVSTLLTSLGFFDNWVAKCKCGLIIPTTGFAHSVASSALDYRNDGLITGLGANFFKLAGSVILYGVISAFLFAFVTVIFNG